MPERIFSCAGSPHTWESLNGRWMAIRWKYFYSSFVGLHIVALIHIRQYFSWFNFLRSEWNIESENLPDEVTNLGIFTIWLASSGCRPHTFSIWPWSGAPKVHLYNTFLGGLCQSYVTALDLKRDKYTIKIGLRRIQSLCHQHSFLRPDLLQELSMESTDSPGKQIVGANGIPRGCMSLPRDLLYISWGWLGTNYIVLRRHLVSTSLDSLDRFLSNIAMPTLKSRQKEFDILRTQLNTWKHLCLIMVTKPRIKGADNTRDITPQKGVILRHFHNMART